MRLSFFLSEALDSLRRNWVMTIASVVIVVITMVGLGGVLVVDRNLKQGTTSLKNRIEIEVFIKDSVSQDPAQLAAVEAKIKALPQLKSYQYISKAQALVDFKKSLGPEGQQILNQLSVNPLPASFKIFVKDPNQVDQVAAQFLHDPAVDSDPGTTNGVSYAKQTVRNLLGTFNLVEKGMWVVTFLFGIAAVLLVSTTVRLSIFARRREIEIMQLVGATNWFIRWPFVFEGFITGLIGSLVAALAVWGANVFIFDWIHSSKLDFLSPAKYPVLFQGGTWPLGLIPTLVIVGAVLGAAGSALALRRYLRV